jgi:ubiquinone/menaquinone biosynthesis C-methylase UbiE
VSDAPQIPTQPGGYEARIGRYGRSLAQAFIAAAGVQPGDRVLDVGCGSGALAAQLAARIGPSAVTGIDPAESDVAQCAARVPGAEILVGEAEHLPFPRGAFEAALAQLVVGHLRDAEQAVREMARVTRGRGTVAACVWDFAEGMTALRAFWDAAAAVDAAGAARFDQARTHPYSTPAELESLWQAAGLTDVGTAELTATAAYADFEDYWQPMLVPDGAPGRFLATIDEGARDTVRAGAFERLGRPAEGFQLAARAWYIEGRVSRGSIARASAPPASASTG